MKKYVVIALSVSGMGNKIFKSKDVISEDQLPPGRAAELVVGGYIKEQSEEVVETSPLPPPKGEMVVEPPPAPEVKSELEVVGGGENLSPAPSEVVEPNAQTEEEEFKAALLEEERQKDELARNLKADEEAKKKLANDKKAADKKAKGGKKGK